MKTGSAFVLALLGLAVSTVGRTQTLETAPANNGSGGVFMDLQPVSEPLRFTGFDVPLGAAAGTPVSVEVWTRTGSYVGFTNSNAGWTLTQTVVSESLGPVTPAPFVLSSSVGLPTESIKGIYLHAVLPAASGNGIRYTGTGAAPPQTMWSNTDIVLFSDTARTGFVAFAGSVFTPRTFSGILRYAPDDTLFEDGFDE